MHIYSLINVENLKVYEPSILNEDEEDQILFYIEYLAPMNRKITREYNSPRKDQNDQKGSTSTLEIRIEGLSTNEKCYFKEKFGEGHPHLLQN